MRGGSPRLWGRIVNGLATFVTLKVGVKRNVSLKGFIDLGVDSSHVLHLEEVGGYLIRDINFLQ